MKRAWQRILRDALLAGAALAAITAAYLAWLHISNPTIVALTYLLVVLLAAAFATLWIAIACSLAAVVLLNYFFMPPIGALTIADPQNWVALGVLLAVSLVASHLSSSVRARAREAIARRDELARLFDVSRDVLQTSESESAHLRLAESIARRFDLDYVGICLPEGSEWRVVQAGNEAPTLPRSPLDAALGVAHGTSEFDARARTQGGHQSFATPDGIRVQLVPLRLGSRPIGLLATAGRWLEAGTLDALAGIAAIAVERVQFLEERKAAELARQSDELKSALLASLAHDLRTPLTAIRVAASNLQAPWADEEQRRAQSDIVLGEVERLTRLFQNILDMAQIETRAVVAAPEPVTPEAIVEAAVAQARQTLSSHRLAVTATDDRTVDVDPRITSAALAHVLENAAAYSPAGTTIAVDASADEDGLRIVVSDEGPGIAQGDLPHLFDRFYRGAEARRRSVGAGMGLAITRGLIAAEGGRVSAENREEGGARFSIAVPAAVRPVTLPSDPP